MIKRFIPFIVAGVFGLAAVVIMHRYLEAQRLGLKKERDNLYKEYQHMAPVDVIVAAQDIPEETALTVEQLVTKPVPQQFVQPYATSRSADVVGWVTKVPIAKDEQVLTNKLRLATELPASATLSGVMPEGKRAVTIGTDALTGVGGFVRPGDMIDVLWTFKVPPPPGGQDTDLVTMTLFQNVSVLAVGNQMIGKAASEQEPSQSYTVTLALTPQETALLLYAREQGQVQLSLRSKTEKDLQVAISPANMSAIMESAFGQAPVAEAPAQQTVEVIRGLEHSVVAVSNE